MGEYNIAASFKIYSEDPAKIDGIKNAIAQFAKVQFAKEEELGFGIKILRLTLLLEDEQGGTENVEQKIRKVPHVSEVEVETVTRI